MTSKILALTDALGNLIDLRLHPGQAHDLRGTADLVVGLACGKLLADRAFDANWLREALTNAQIKAVIPPKSNRRFPAEFDRDTYKWRHLIENFFGKLKEFRGIATRYCKTDDSFTAFISLVATVIRTRGTSTGPKSAQSSASENIRAERTTFAKIQAGRCLACAPQPSNITNNSCIPGKSRTVSEWQVAEAVGFEPTVGFPLRSVSNRVLSASQPRFRYPSFSDAARRGQEGKGENWDKAGNCAPGAFGGCGGSASPARRAWAFGRWLAAGAAGFGFGPVQVLRVDRCAGQWTCAAGRTGLRGGRTCRGLALPRGRVSHGFAKVTSAPKDAGRKACEKWLP